MMLALFNMISIKFGTSLTGIIPLGVSLPGTNRRVLRYSYCSLLTKALFVV